MSLSAAKRDKWELAEAGGSQLVKRGQSLPFFCVPHTQTFILFLNQTLQKHAHTHTGVHVPVQPVYPGVVYWNRLSHLRPTPSLHDPVRRTKFQTVDPYVLLPCCNRAFWRRTCSGSSCLVMDIEPVIVNTSKELLSALRFRDAALFHPSIPHIDSKSEVQLWPIEHPHLNCYLPS